MPSDVPCGGDAFECKEDVCCRPTDPEWGIHPTMPLCEQCAKSARNGGRCGGGAPEVEA